mgnify:CR=1 FL=1
MCGIIASYNCKWESDPLKTISHRGPDNSSSFEAGSLYMGHSRLSILDTSAAANQPMISKDANYVLIYNGEIYNHIEIREELINKYKVKFKTTSDTETLLEGWSLEGESFLKRLNGIFAFAIYSRKDDTLTLVRDIFGVKPLYIYQKNDQLAISSELKSFNQLEDFDGTINPTGIANYLTFLWSPGETTMYRYVKKLLPGRLMEFKTSQGLTNEYQYKHYESCHSYKGKNEEEYINITDKILNDAIKRQMLSDVPIGFFLSGGLDSSLIVAIAKKQNPNKRFQCFTIDTSTVDGREGFTNDLPYARKVSEVLDVELNEIKPIINDLSCFDQMIFALDEPQADLAPLNVRLIAKEAKRHGIKVLIGGTAGDDLFSGYRRHLAIKFEKTIDCFPRFSIKLIQLLVSILPSKKPFYRRLKKLTRDWDKNTIERLLGYFNWLPREDLLYELIPKLPRNTSPYSYGLEIIGKNKDKSLLKQMLKLEQTTFLVDHNLNYTDKLSMLEGVEVRVPFLDYEISALAEQIPDSLLIKNGETKYILKKVAERYLPKEVIYRSKTGFGAPVRDMIDSEFKPYIDKYLNHEFINKQSIFSSESIRSILDLHRSGKEDYGYTILSLLAIQTWLQQFEWKNSFKS